MKILKPLIVLFLLPVSFISCNDDGPDKEGPTIEIKNIADNTEYKFGANLVMEFKFTDQTGVYEYKYEIYTKDFSNDSFSYDKHITFSSYYTLAEDKQSMFLPEKSEREIYQEGDYLIKVQASDINQNVSTYYKPIKIVYPTE